MFQLEGSSEENLLDSQQQAQPTQQITSSSVIKDGGNDDAIYDESAIDDEDDSSDWEDSDEGSDKSSVIKLNFERVDSSANLTSRQSLITLMLAQSQVQRNSRLASQSTSALSRTWVSP
jgi:hypothetical protein